MLPLGYKRLARASLVTRPQPILIHTQGPFRLCSCLDRVANAIGVNPTAL